MTIDLHITDGHVTPTAAALCNLSFNPSGDTKVTEAKVLAARLVSILEPIREGGGEAGRRAVVAITEIEGAAMWAVKAITTPAPEPAPEAAP